MINHNDWDVLSLAWALHTSLPMTGIVSPLRCPVPPGMSTFEFRHPLRLQAIYCDDETLQQWHAHCLLSRAACHAKQRAKQTHFFRSCLATTFPRPLPNHGLDGSRSARTPTQANDHKADHARCVYPQWTAKASPDKQTPSDRCARPCIQCFSPGGHCIIAHSPRTTTANSNPNPPSPHLKKYSRIDTSADLDAPRYRACDVISTASAPNRST